jgi:hypothetical protein
MMSLPGTAVNTHPTPKRDRGGAPHLVDRAVQAGRVSDSHLEWPSPLERPCRDWPRS